MKINKQDYIDKFEDELKKKIIKENLSENQIKETREIFKKVLDEANGKELSLIQIVKMTRKIKKLRMEAKKTNELYHVNSRDIK